MASVLAYAYNLPRVHLFQSFLRFAADPDSKIAASDNQKRSYKIAREIKQEKIQQDSSG